MQHRIIYLYKHQKPMRRPQSAKPGYRHNNYQPSFEDFREEHSHIQKHNRKHNVKLLKPDLTTNDFGRVMPKKIQQDKQRLYSEALQLKQSYNEISEENVRLKTRITILEKQKDKMNRYIESNVNEGSKKGNSRLNMYSGSHLKSSNNVQADKQNMMVRNLKKMIRQSKEQNQSLKQENIKIKKAIKYTRINELEIEKKLLLEQNQRINNILLELNEQLGEKDDYEEEIIELKKYLEEEVEANRQLSENNQKYLEYIEELEDKLKVLEQKKEEKEKKLIRENGLLKRKNNEFVRINDDLRKQNRQLRQRQQEKKRPNKAMNRPVTSNPYSKNNPNNRSAVMPSSDKQLEQTRTKNRQLQKQLEQVKLRLERSETQLQMKKQQRQKTEENPSLKMKTEEKSYNDEYEFDESEKNEPHFILNEDKKNNYEDSYAEEFEKEHEEIEKKDAFAKEGKGNKAKSAKKDKKGYKPDKKILTQIKELLTYRMKAQRYPFNQLEKDINLSEEKEFLVPDLRNMMKSEPFYLTEKYANIFLQYCLESENIQENKRVTIETFLKKIQKLIQNFELLPQEQEEQILIRIAQMATQYPGQLENAFEQIKNGPETVSKDKMVDMFKKLDLADQYIQAIIAELSLYSEDLQHLNFHGFFERFYIDQEQTENNEQMNAPINEQQIESSGEDRSLSKQTPLNPDIPKIDEEQEYEDDKVNFILDDQGELSMGMKNNELPDEQDIVSDDGRI